jgi:hypothetical protein
MEFELFTVGIKQDGTVGVHFNPKLLGTVTEEELLNEMSGKMDDLLPIAESIVDFIKSKG